jgi:hypothetical protein
LRLILNIRHNRDMLTWAFNTNFANSSRRATSEINFDMAP